jgi:hypothetical protein
VISSDLRSKMEQKSPFDTRTQGRKNDGAFAADRGPTRKTDRRRTRRTPTRRPAPRADRARRRGAAADDRASEPGLIFGRRSRRPRKRRDPCAAASGYDGDRRPSDRQARAESARRRLPEEHPRPDGRTPPREAKRPQPRLRRPMRGRRATRD